MKKKWMRFMAVLIGASMLAASVSGCGSSAGEASSESENIQDGSSTLEDSASSEDNDTGSEPSVDTSRQTTDSGELYDTIVVGLSSDPTDLSPIQPTLNSKPYFYWEIYECLFDLDGDEYIPALAKSYTIIDELHYQVEIWDNITDSDGNNITADDVVYSFEWRESTGEMDQMSIFESVEKVDNYTVEFTWTEEPTDIAALEGPWCRTIIFSQKAMDEHNFATDPVGTGPYKVTEFVSGSKIVLEARDDYWASQEVLANMTNAHKANVKTIEYHVITEPAQQVVALQTGSIDFSLSVPTESISDFLEGGAYSDQYSAFQSASNMYYRLEPNCSSDSLCGDENLRLAIFYALDNEAIAQAVSGLEACTALGSDWYADYVSDWDNMETYINTQNEELAKEYLEKSNYNGETLVLCGNNTEQIKNIMVFIQALLQNVGINVEISANESTINREMRNHTDQWDLAVVSIGGTTLIGSAYGYIDNEKNGTGMTSNFVADDQLQSLYEACLTVDGHTDENMTALYEYILDNAYMYMIASQVSNTVYTKDIAEIYYREGQYETMGGSTFYLD